MKIAVHYYLAVSYLIASLCHANPALAPFSDEADFANANSLALAKERLQSLLPPRTLLARRSDLLNPKSRAARLLENWSGSDLSSLSDSAIEALLLNPETEKEFRSRVEKSGSSDLEFSDRFRLLDASAQIARGEKYQNLSWLQSHGPFWFGAAVATGLFQTFKTTEPKPGVSPPSLTEAFFLASTFGVTAAILAWNINRSSSRARQAQTLKDALNLLPPLLNPRPDSKQLSAENAKRMLNVVESVFGESKGGPYFFSSGIDKDNLAMGEVRRQFSSFGERLVTWSVASRNSDALPYLVRMLEIIKAHGQLEHSEWFLSKNLVKESLQMLSIRNRTEPPPGLKPLSVGKVELSQLVEPFRLVHLLNEIRYGEEIRSGMANWNAGTGVLTVEVDRPMLRSLKKHSHSAEGLNLELAKKFPEGVWIRRGVTPETLKFYPSRLIPVLSVEASKGIEYYDTEGLTAGKPFLTYTPGSRETVSGALVRKWIAAGKTTPKLSESNLAQSATHSKCSPRQLVLFQ